MASSANSTIREFGVALGIALLVAVFLGNGGELTPGGYDGAVGPAMLTGAAAVARRRDRGPVRPGSRKGRRASGMIARCPRRLAYAS